MKELNVILIEPKELIKELKEEIFKYDNKKFGTDIHFKVLTNKTDENNLFIFIFKNANRIGSVQFRFKEQDKINLPDNLINDIKKGKPEKTTTNSKDTIYALVEKIFK